MRCNCSSVLPSNPAPTSSIVASASSRGGEHVADHTTRPARRRTAALLEHRVQIGLRYRPGGREAEQQAGDDRECRARRRGRSRRRGRRGSAAGSAAATRSSRARPRSRALRRRRRRASRASDSRRAVAAARRARLAPSAVRIAISLSRATARPSSRFATFAHAISSTQPTAASSTQSDVAADRRTATAETSRGACPSP